MAKSTEPPKNSKTYGVPIYGASWVPPNAFRTDPTPTPEAERRDGEGKEEENEPVAGVDAGNYLVFAGGGGKGNSGIPNAIILSHFDFSSNSLSDQPVARLGTGPDLPYRMAVHPGGDGIICSLPESCRCFEWDAVNNNGVHKVGLKLSDKVLNQMEDLGDQLALTFNNEGSVLALGGEDGKLRVFKWPGMKSILYEANAYSSVKGLDFSVDGKFLVSVGTGGPGRVWDMESSTPVASLPKENDEVFGCCRFSQNTDNQFLYFTATKGKRGSIVRWDTSSWKRVSSTCLVRDHISAFDVSADGKLLAIGTVEGDVLIVNSASMRVQNMVKKAHLGIVTTLMFSQDSRALVSASMDSSARVTLIKDVKKNGSSLWIVVFIILLAVAVYYMKTEGILP